ncbi:MAG: hypothetical protein ACRBFS_02775 [Aureispira sp.]
MTFLIKNSLLVVGLLLMGVSWSKAQELIDRTDDTYLFHWGVTGAVGISNQLDVGLSPQAMAGSELSSIVNIQYGPRPAATLGFFTEHEMEGKPWLFRSSLMYTLRGVPRINFKDNGNAGSIFLNGLAFDGLLFFKPKGKVMVGAGFDFAQFFLTKKIKESDNAGYIEGLQSYRGIKVVVAYHLSNRTDLNVYGAFGNSNLNVGMQVDNIGGGVSLTHKIYGKKIRIIKEKSSINYEKPSL